MDCKTGKDAHIEAPQYEFEGEQPPPYEAVSEPPPPYVDMVDITYSTGIHGQKNWVELMRDWCNVRRDITYRSRKYITHEREYDYIVDFVKKIDIIYTLTK